ncbi:hypothetical protein ACMFMG_002859 [Clarireedia jacksonii]
MAMEMAMEMVMAMEMAMAMEMEMVMEMAMEMATEMANLEMAMDILFCGTGWAYKYPFLTEKQTVEFGLPHPPEDDPELTSKMWAGLLEAADRQVVSDFPKLGYPPGHYHKERSLTPPRLYNGIAPFNDDSIVFVGHVVLSNAFRSAEAQAIWVTAYFDGNAKIPSSKQATKEIVYAHAFSKRRYSAHGATDNYFHLDLA